MLWHYPSNADCRPSLRKIFCVISYNFRHTFVACCPQSYPLTHATYHHSMQFHYSHWVVQCGCQSGGIHDRQAIFHMVKTEAHGQEFLCIRAAILNEPGKRYVFGLSVCLCVRFVRAYMRMRPGLTCMPLSMAYIRQFKTTPMMGEGPKDGIFGTTAILAISQALPSSLHRTSSVPAVQPLSRWRTMMWLCGFEDIVRQLILTSCKLGVKAWNFVHPSIVSYWSIMDIGPS